MSLLDAFLLFVSMLGLAVLPSSSVALVVTHAATRGFSHGAAVTAGIVLGDLIFVCLAVLGMAALAELLGGLLFLVRYLAGFVLICLGVSLILSRSAAICETRAAGAASYKLSFFSGLLVTLADAKAIVFYASFLPAFVDLRALTLCDLTVLTLVTVAGVGGVKLGYAWAASRMRSAGEMPAAAPGIKLFAGGIMTGAGAWLLVKL